MSVFLLYKQFASIVFVALPQLLQTTPTLKRRLMIYPESRSDDTVRDAIDDLWSLGIALCCDVDIHIYESLS